MEKGGGRDEQQIDPVSGLLNPKSDTFCVIAVKCPFIMGIIKVPDV